MPENQDPNAIALVQSGFKLDEGDKGGNEKTPPGTVVIDVNKSEEKEKVDPRETSPPEGSKRWKEVYGKMKEYERQLEEVKGDKKQTDLLVTEMRNHNQKLVSSIEEMTDATKSASQEKTKVSEVTRIEEQIKSVKAKRVEAMKSLDYDSADDLTDSLGNLREQLKEINKAPVKQQQDDKTSVDPVTQTWIAENAWFRADAIMRDAAIAYEEQLTQEFPNEPLDVILSKVKVKIIEKFHLKEDGTNKNTSVALVEGGNSNSFSTTGKGTVRLNPTEVMLAEGLGVSLEDYAKQKVMTGGR